MNLREETIKVLRPFRDVVENDIGDDEADVDTFIPMSRQYARARILTVGDLRAAAALLSRLCATCADAPAVDTSAEKLLALADRVRRHLNLQGDSLTTLLRDCEAALRSLAAHPAEPAGMELETTAEARRYWTEEGPPFLNVAHEDRAMLARDFDRMRARAEKAEAATVIERERAEIAEKGRREAKTQLRDAQARGKGVEEGWQPIETAPKDGTPVLAWMLWYPHGLQGREEYAERNCDILRWTTFNAGGWVHYVLGQPTHWMHLPPPPDAALSRPEGSAS